ncbi:Hypothetical predicted protein [Mytilus galloprovincialis]|uniref:Lipoprotein n=1 Tax=Mytilus galloprovincialis TaxID=29158 RepID=A0A8B6C607_MYTGA|nr:Hypothetical predicted protein [Mytilus galloprovincialis]
MLKIKMRVIYVLSLVILTTCEDETLSKHPHSKRILLNNPDVVGQRLLHIETLLRDLQVKYSHQEGVITSLQNELADERLKHEQSIQSHGSTYIRWGRNKCSIQNTELVYKGYAAGEQYLYSASYKGGASNMLCLPDDPELSNKTASTHSQIFGTEFENNDLVAGSLNEDVSCALCRSTNTSSTVMFPGRIMLDGKKNTMEF